MRVWRVALDVPLETLFDYLPPQALVVEPGDRVAVPFGTRQRVGIAVETASQTDVDESKLKEITGVLVGAPRLPHHWLDFIRFLAGYYQRPFGETAVAALPPRLRSLRPLPKKIRAAVASSPSGTPHTNRTAALDTRR